MSLTELTAIIWKNTRLAWATFLTKHAIGAIPRDPDCFAAIGALERAAEAIADVP